MTSRSWAHVRFSSWTILAAGNSQPVCSNICCGVFRVPVDLRAVLFSAVKQRKCPEFIARASTISRAASSVSWTAAISSTTGKFVRATQFSRSNRMACTQIAYRLPEGEYHLAGCIIGVVDRGNIIDDRKIRPGDAVLALESNGLHTNGYSLAREILFNRMNLKVSSRLPGSTNTVGKELLRVHKNYQPLLAKMPIGMIKGLAHITGGGLVDNLPRILPANCDAVIETKNWRVPRIFQILQQNGNIDLHEMYQVFNMGIGMVVVVSEHDARCAMLMLKAKRIGQIARGNGRVRLKFWISGE